SGAWETTTPNATITATVHSALSNVHDAVDRWRCRATRRPQRPSRTTGYAKTYTSRIGKSMKTDKRPKAFAPGGSSGPVAKSTRKIARRTRVVPTTTRVARRNGPAIIQRADVTAARSAGL